MNVKKHTSSFRDPSGYIYCEDNRLLRRVHEIYFPDFNLLNESGLYTELVSKGWLVEHSLVDGTTEDKFLTLEPQLIPYISYPYEWSFSQLKDAALLTLDVQEKALHHGMSLKDASAYNVQFQGAKPTFIDTLSFERLVEERPWVAYRQFCQHFLAPLALMSYRDVRLRHLLFHFIDGIPLDMAKALLPRRSLFRYSLLAHIHLHSTSQQRHDNDGANDAAVAPLQNMSLARHLALVASLRSAISKLKLDTFDSEWGDYYTDTNYSDEAMDAKQSVIADLLGKMDGVSTVHDLGANTGRFSAIARQAGYYVVSHDIDENAVENHYLQLKQSTTGSTLPLLLDLTNPSPKLGWHSAERESFIERVSGNCVMALALIHHLAISNNVPLPELAQFFAAVCKYLIIEFVPKSDSQVKRLLASRVDIFPDYTQVGFEQAFAEVFEVVSQTEVTGSDRVLYLMRHQSE